MIEGSTEILRQLRTQTTKQSKSSNNNRLAIKEWSQHLLPERDYNYTEWRIMFHSRSTVDFFNGYAKKLSTTFGNVGAKVNFAMVGAWLVFLHKYISRNMLQ